MIVRLSLVFVSVLISFVLLEGGYRSYLYLKDPKLFVQEARRPRSLSFISRTLWEFDEEFGYRYRRDSPLVTGSLLDGQVVQCSQLGPNELGGMGTKTVWRDDAELRILVFGDSFTATSERGRTWTDYLQDELTSHVGKSVDVINLGMDGIGVLQMFDVASRKVPQLKPDLAIFAFITDDLTRARIWRTTIEVDGRSRVFTTTQPQRNPDLRHAVDRALIGPKVTLEWCNRSPRPHRDSDPIVRDLEQRYRLAVAIGGAREDLFALDRSLVLKRIRWRFGGCLTQHTRQNPRHELVRFFDDERMLRNVALLRDTSTPLLLFHFATRTELRSGEEYRGGDGRCRSLLASLETLTGSRVLESREHLEELPVDRIDAMAVSSTDDHPSGYGMQMYAKAVAKAVMRDEIGALRALRGR